MSDLRRVGPGDWALTRPPRRPWWQRLWDALISVTRDTDARP